MHICGMARPLYVIIPDMSDSFRLTALLEWEGPMDDVAG